MIVDGYELKTRAALDDGGNVAAGAIAQVRERAPGATDIDISNPAGTFGSSAKETRDGAPTWREIALIVPRVFAAGDSPGENEGVVHGLEAELVPGTGDEDDREFCPV